MKESFIRDSFTVESIAAGSGVINWKVKGFWAVPLQVFFERNFSNEWKFRISQHSGGHEEDFDTVELARNLAAALEDAADTVEFLKSIEDQIEAAFLEKEKARAVL